MTVWAETSGWQYRDWRGGLYPAGVAQRRRHRGAGPAHLPEDFRGS
jgi:uncharacterized protein YecE (DUF72 family)